VSCSNYVEESDIDFIKPEPSRPMCNELVYNGDFDLGKDGWYAFHYAIDLQERGGIDGTAALASTKPLNAANNIAQSIDGACLQDGDEYDISLSYKIVNYDGSNNLPYVRIESKDYLTSDPSGNQLHRKNINDFPTSSEFVPDGWNTISGVWKIDKDTAGADVHIFNVGGGSHKVVIDNVTFRRRPQPSSAPTLEPSIEPSSRPSAGASNRPSLEPSIQPSLRPSVVPSNAQSLEPSTRPSSLPSVIPSNAPSFEPSTQPSSLPSVVPSNAPSFKPSTQPSSWPSVAPSNGQSLLEPSTQQSSRPSVGSTHLLRSGFVY